MTIIRTAMMMALLYVAVPVSAQEAAESEFRSFDENIHYLKQDILQLTKDLFVLEEELLYPANSQVAFFVSMDVGEYFDLSSVRLQIDGRMVASYLYTPREVDALARGGVHRIHVEDLTAGEHELTVDLIGDGLKVSDFRRGATINFEKGIGAKYVELEITDRVTRQQPEFVVREWE